MDHHILIGAGSGIGAALARKLAAPGTALLLHTGRNRAHLDAVAESCRVAGALVDTCLGTTADPALYEAVGTWAAARPSVASLSFAAGYARTGTVTDTPSELLAEALEAMPLAFHKLTALVAPHLQDHRGRVVCVSAFGAHRSRERSFAATAPAKAALEAQVKVFAANLAPRGITVNAVVPGYVEKDPGTHSSLTPAQWQEVTATIPMGRIATRDEIASVMRFLLSEEAGYLTGQSLHVNGGLTL